MAVITGTNPNGQVLSGTTAADSITGLGGPDSIFGGGGNDTIDGGAGNDSIVFGTTGDPGSALVFGNVGDDTITNLGVVLSGNNTIVGGQDSLDGNDVINVASDTGRDVLIANGGNDTLLAGQGGSTISGGFGNDTISAPVHGEFIYGNEGDDTINESNTSTVGVADTIVGGQGTDSINIAAMVNNSLIFGAEGADTIQIGVNSGGFATIVGGVDSTDAADFIGISGGFNDLIFGNGGNDSVTVGGAVTGAQTVVGGFGDDSIVNNLAVNATNDLILGNEGNDFIFNTATFASGGTETILGGLGNDSIFAGDGNENDLIVGGENSDFVDVGGGSGNVTVWGGVDTTGGAADGSNTITTSGHLGGDVVFAGSAADSVSVLGKTVADTITGGAGNDTIQVANGAGSAASKDVTGLTTTTALTAGLIDAITDFVSGQDTLRTGLAATAVTNGGDQTATNNLLTAANNALGAAGAGGASVFKFGSDSYLVENLSATGGYQAGIDVLIDIKSTSMLTAADIQA